MHVLIKVNGLKIGSVLLDTCVVLPNLLATVVTLEKPMEYNSLQYNNGLDFLQKIIQVFRIDHSFLNLIHDTQKLDSSMKMNKKTLPPYLFNI